MPVASKTSAPDLTSSSGSDLADLGAERGERRGDGVAHAPVAADHGGSGEGGLAGLVTAERPRLGQAEPLGDEAPRGQGGELLVSV